jgi:prepilin-type N-terminal cleavage/methylation domain-containing protein
MKLNSRNEGLSLVEVLVAITLLAVVLTSIAAMSYKAARQAVNTSSSSYRQGVMMQEINRMTALPFTSLAGQAGCTTVSTGTFPHTRCIAVSGNTQQVMVSLIVTPAMPGVAADTVTFTRTRPPLGNPLNL